MTGHVTGSVVQNDWWARPPEERMTVLYRLYGENDVLLYVGISGRWLTRMKQHSKDKPWFDDVASVRIERFCSKSEALAAERAAIHAEHPKHNIAHNTEPERKSYDFKISVNTAMRAWAEDAQRIIQERPETLAHTFDHVAEILGMPYRVVEGMVRSGHLQSIKIGPTELVLTEDLLEYVDKIAGEVT